MAPDSEHRIRLDRALDPSGPALDRLVAVRQLRTQLDRLEREAVRAARSQGATFGGIARALGLSRQAVHQRYRDIPAEEPESPEDQWWRVRREQERMVERWSLLLRAKEEAAQAPMA
jgi:hypothetical protein